jgi:hypothetical protein
MDMMKEIQGVADEPRTHRRWFHDDEFDLFVWQTETGDVTLFQLCYGMGSNERALVWHRDVGFFHDGAGFAQGASTAGGKESALAKGADDPIIARFEAAAQSIPTKVRRAVSQRVREYLSGGVRAAARRKRFRREQWQDPSAARPSAGATGPETEQRPRGR